MAAGAGEEGGVTVPILSGKERKVAAPIFIGIILPALALWAVILYILFM